MSDQYIGEIRLVGFNFAPQGWALCNGQLLAINQNQALFALLGTTFGGNGTSNFALPNLQSRVPVGVGQGSGLSSYVWGQVGGNENVTLSLNQMPTHNHALVASDQTASQPLGASNYLPGNSGRGGGALYANTVSTPQTMASPSIGINGGNQPHTNIQPYLGLYYIIALTGIYPSRS